MSTDIQIVGTLHLALALICLWLLVFYFARTYRVDALRQRLFALRDELFDYATSGAISYDDPAYWRLRLLINGMIRFAHRLTFHRFLLTVLVNSLRPNPCLTQPFQEWLKAVEAIPDPDARKRLHEFNSRMNEVLVRHLITGSPTFWLMLVIFAVGALISSAVWSFIKTAGSVGLQLLEAEAAQVYKGEKRAFA